MTLYAIFDPKPGSSDLPAAVPERFSWAAALLPPVFLLAHGLWLELVLWVVGLVGLLALSLLVGAEATMLVYLLLAVWLGLTAPGLRRSALRRRGWIERGPRLAASADLAQLEAIR